MNTKILVFLWAVVCFSFSPWIKAETECDSYLVNRVELKRAALEAIHAAKSNFGFSLLTREVNGKPRLVLLAGEVHFKGKKASGLGKKLIEQFPNRGLEGADVSKTWGGRVFKLSLNMIFFLPKLFLRQSSIRDALEMPGKNFRLEAGHTPDLSENVASIYIPAMMAMGIFSAGGHLIPDHSHLEALKHVLNTVQQYFSYHSGLGGALSAADYPLKGRIFKREWLRVLFPFPAGILHERNATIVKNIDKIFADDDKTDTLLVLVGRMHIGDMTRRLVEGYGYQTAEIPPLK